MLTRLASALGSSVLALRFRAGVIAASVPCPRVRTGEDSDSDSDEDTQWTDTEETAGGKASARPQSAGSATEADVEPLARVVTLEAGSTQDPDQTGFNAPPEEKLSKKE